MTVIWALVFILAVLCFWLMTLLGLPGNWMIRMAATLLYAWLVPGKQWRLLALDSGRSRCGLGSAGRSRGAGRERAASVKKKGGSRRGRHLGDTVRSGRRRYGGPVRGPADPGHRLRARSAAFCWGRSTGGRHAWRILGWSIARAQLEDRPSRILGPSIGNCGQGVHWGSHGRRGRRRRVSLESCSETMKRDEFAFARRGRGVTAGVFAYND